MSKPKPEVKDFEFIETIGFGSTSEVRLAKHTESGALYALKTCSKRHLLQKKLIDMVKREKDILVMLNENPHAGICRLIETFQDDYNIYLQFPFVKNGEMYEHIAKNGSLDVESVTFYAAELLDVLDYLHKRGIIHRDVRPENILLNDEFHLQLSDFGSACLADTPPGKGEGTPQYMSPEMIRTNQACEQSDIWAFGCTIYKCFAGITPFAAPSEWLVFSRIDGLDLSFPDYFPPTAKTLVEQILVADPKARPSIEEIKKHPFFQGVDFATIRSKTPPTMKPLVDKAIVDSYLNTLQKPNEEENWDDNDRSASDKSGSGSDSDDQPEPDEEVLRQAYELVQSHQAEKNQSNSSAKEP